MSRAEKGLRDAAGSPFSDGVLGVSPQRRQQIVDDAAAVGVAGIAPHDMRRTCAKLCRAAGGELEQIQLLLGHSSVQTTERYLGTKQDLVHAPNDGIKLVLVG